MVMERIAIAHKKTATISKKKLPSLLLCRHNGKNRKSKKGNKKAIIIKM